MNPVTIKTINFKFENVSFTKLQKKVTNKVNPPNHRLEMKKMWQLIQTINSGKNKTYKIQPVFQLLYSQ